MNISQAAFPNLQELVRLFYRNVEDLANFELVPDGKMMAEPYRQLLDHNHHMTVTVESYHGCPVDVQVLDHSTHGTTYQRKILLTRTSDRQVVMFGIVRLHLQYLASQVAEEILSRQIPLGRVLINNNVLRRVELGELWQVLPEVELQRHFNLDAARLTFGRTAIIHCDEEPAIELLEIVVPEN